MSRYRCCARRATSVSSEAIDTPADPAVELRAGGELHFKLPRIRSASAEAVDPDQQPLMEKLLGSDQAMSALLF